MQKAKKNIRGGLGERCLNQILTGVKQNLIFVENVVNCNKCGWGAKWTTLLECLSRRPLLTARSLKLPESIWKEIAFMFTTLAALATLLAIVGDVLMIWMFADSVRNKKKWGCLPVPQAPPKSRAGRESYRIPSFFTYLYYITGTQKLQVNFSLCFDLLYSICGSRKKYQLKWKNFAVINILPSVVICRRLVECIQARDAPLIRVVHFSLNQDI